MSVDELGWKDRTTGNIVSGADNMGEMRTQVVEEMGEHIFLVKFFLLSWSGIMLQ